MRRTTLVLAVLLLVVPAVAQQSTSFKLEESTFNAGGNPSGTNHASANFLLTLSSIGDTVSAAGMGSASYRMEGGFPSWFPPPGEVRDLRFTDGQTLQWDHEKSIGSYGLYSGAVDGLVIADYGICLDDAIETASTIVGGSVPSGEVHFYLVTAKNRLGEEGTTGFDSGGAERPDGTPCP